MKMDIVIVSNAVTQELRGLTENCLYSLRYSEIDGFVSFNIVVIESSRLAADYSSYGAQTVYPTSTFGYHKYLNIGIRMTSAPYICICNNDLVFGEHWASEIVSAFINNPLLVSASPFCGMHHPKLGLMPDSGLCYGYQVGREVAGWCIAFRRDILDTTGYLDEKFRFWYADNDFSNTLKLHSLRHALVTSSRVDHLVSQTLRTETEERIKLLTIGERSYYQYKWENKPLLQFHLDKFKLYFKIFWKRIFHHA
jgi:GT2 family glycosyltransferase